MQIFRKIWAIYVNGGVMSMVGIFVLIFTPFYVQEMQTEFLIFVFVIIFLICIYLTVVRWFRWLRERWWRLRGPSRSRRADGEFARMSERDRRKLAKLLGLLGSDHDGEALAAARQAEGLRRRAGVSWSDVLQPAPRDM